MSNKTVLENLKEYFEQQLSLHSSGEIKYTTEEVLIDAIQVCHNAKETKEREQIEKVFADGCAINSFNGVGSTHRKVANEYYLKTFKND
jgi:hypothetical protein